MSGHQVRVHKLAERVNVSSKEMLEILRERGHNCKSASSTIDIRTARRIFDELSDTRNMSGASRHPFGKAEADRDAEETRRPSPQTKAEPKGWLSRLFTFTKDEKDETITDEDHKRVDDLLEKYCYDEIEEASEKVRKLLELADALREKGEKSYEELEVCWSARMILAQEEKCEPELWVKTLLRLCKALRYSAHYKEHKACAEEVTHFVQEQGANERWNASALYEESWSLRLDEKYPEAHRKLEESKGILARLDLSRLHLRVEAHMADLLIILGKRENSFKIRKELLAKTTEFYGKKQHPEVGECLYSLAKSYNFQRQDEKALEYAEKSVRLFDETDCVKHPKYADALDERCSSLSRMNRHREAFADAKRVLGIRERVHRGSHPLVGDAHGRLGHCLSNLSRNTRALEQFHKALDIKTATFGKGHIGTVNACFNLAGCLERLSKHGPALKLFLEAYHICHRIFGDKHPSTARALASHGRALYNNKRYPEAISELRRALDIGKQTLEDDHPFIADTLLLLGYALNATNQLFDGLEVLKEALSHRKDNLGEKDPDTLKAMVHVAESILATKGDAKQALDLANQAYETMADKESPEAAEALVNVGLCLGRLERHEEGLTALKQALAAVSNTVGKKHPQFFEIKAHLEHASHVRNQAVHGYVKEEVEESTFEKQFLDRESGIGSKLFCQLAILRLLSFADRLDSSETRYFKGDASRFRWDEIQSAEGMKIECWANGSMRWDDPELIELVTMVFARALPHLASTDDEAPELSDFLRSNSFKLEDWVSIVPEFLLAFALLEHVWRRIDDNNSREEEQAGDTGEHTLFLDLKTTKTKTPVEVDQPRIISIGWRIAHGDRVAKGEEEKFFIIEPDGFEIDQDSYFEHGVTQDDAVKKGVRLEKALEALCMDCRDLDLLVVHERTRVMEALGLELLKRKNPCLFYFLAIPTLCTFEESKIRRLSIINDPTRHSEISPPKGSEAAKIERYFRSCIENGKVLRSELFPKNVLDKFYSQVMPFFGSEIPAHLLRGALNAQDPGRRERKSDSRIFSADPWGINQPKEQSVLSVRAWKKVEDLVSELASWKPGEKVRDPSCGSGSLLLNACNHQLEKLSEEAGQSPIRENGFSNNFIAHEADPVQANFAKVANLLLVSQVSQSEGYGESGFSAKYISQVAPRIQVEDSIRQFLNRHGLFKAPPTYNLILSAPPYGERVAGMDDLTVKGHSVYLKIIDKDLAEKGRAVVVLPATFLATESNEEARKFLLEKKKLKAVVHLPDSQDRSGRKGLAVLFFYHCLGHGFDGVNFFEVNLGKEKEFKKFVKLFDGFRESNFAEPLGCNSKEQGNSEVEGIACWHAPYTVIRSGSDCELTPARWKPSPLFASYMEDLKAPMDYWGKMHDKTRKNLEILDSVRGELEKLSEIHARSEQLGALCEVKRGKFFKKVREDFHSRPLPSGESREIADSGRAIYGKGQGGIGPPTISGFASEPFFAKKAIVQSLIRGSRRGFELGKPLITPISWSANESLVIVMPRTEDESVHNYIFHWLAAYRDSLKFSSASVQTVCRELAEMQIPYPEEADRRFIVDLLKKMGDLDWEGSLLSTHQKAVFKNLLE